MDNSEKLSIEITLKPTVLKSKNKSPRIKIGVNGNTLAEVDCLPDNVGTMKLNYDVLVPEGDNVLEISLVNKESDRDTVVTNGQIVDDLNCEILGITMEGVELDNLVRKHGIYYPAQAVVIDDTETTVMPGHTFLSWNGTYRFRFSSPLYMWLLENI